MIDEDTFPCFGTVILDEAFDRAAMEVSRLSGFHMILATPEKLLQALEDHIGGVLVVG